MASVDHLAVIVRVHDEASIDVARAMPVDPEGAERLESLLAERLQRMFPPYAFEESLRQAWVDALAKPARFEVVPSLQVASALGSLLAKEENPRYDRLSSIGVDAVLEINITDWGLRANSEHLGGVLRINARLIRLDRRERVVWRTRERINRVRAEVIRAEEAPVLLESDAALQDVLGDLLSYAGRRLARSMRVAGDSHRDEGI